MSSIYFPLRSNVHYWDLEPLDLDLESRLKLSTILYDELVFDPGTVSYTHLDVYKRQVRPAGYSPAL